MNTQQSEKSQRMRTNVEIMAITKWVLMLLAFMTVKLNHLVKASLRSFPPSVVFLSR